MKPCKPRWLQGDGPVTQHGPRDPGETRISFTAGETAVPDVLRTVVASLQRRHVHQDDIDSAQIVLAELLNNVEEHAYDGRAGGAVTLQMDLTEGHVSFSIFDHGKPMPEGPLPEGRLPEIDATQPETWPEGGFGWAIVRQLCKDVRYRRSGLTNEWHVVIAFSNPRKEHLTNSRN